MTGYAFPMQSENWSMPKHFVSRHFVSKFALGAALLLGAAAPGFTQPVPVAKAAKPKVLTAQAAAPAPTPAPPKEWSGESGSSGHPDMEARAIRAAAANFE